MTSRIPDPTVAQEEFYLEQRLLVLRVFRALMPVALPLYAWLTLPGWFAGDPDIIRTIEAMLFALITAMVWILRERKIEWSIALWNAGFLMVTTFSLINNGAGIGVGMMFMAWSLSMVFFYDAFRAPPVIFLVVFLIIGWLVSANLFPTNWQYPGHNRWGQMASSGLLLVLAIDYLIMRLLRRTRTTLEEKLKAQLALANSQRLESVGKLAGGVAHDFNNALMVIMGTVELLKVESDPAKRDALLDQIDRATEGAQATTQQLISFTRQASMPGGTCSPEDCLTEVAASMRRLLPEQIKVRVEIEPGPNAAIPMGQLQQILLNLCLNARDAMPNGGDLTLGNHYSGDSVEVTVTDTGEGIDKETQKNTFKAFFTTKPGLGSGLGLTMVNRIVEEAGGEISVQSSIESGTRFRITLPVADAPIANRKAETPSNEIATNGLTGNRQILLLEDEPQVRATLSNILAQAGYQVTEAATVEESLNIALDGIDLVLSDAVLPDGNPRRLIEKSHSQKVPVIVCSGYMKDDVLDQDVSGFLQKPVSRKTLLETIEQVLTNPG